ncbi:MAG: M20/M25/M40 family metallo-hydrolase [Lachnospiraceae bacterium]|nr:M20/M25/M40 family metallo-hydrolase [Lachnospiraceae bacterium]
MNQADMTEYAGAHWQEAYELLTTLARIPAPSGKEDRRAEFIRAWLVGKGAKEVFIDEAKNVIYPIGDTGHNQLTVFSAHTDVVFPDETPLPLEEKDGMLYAPGIGDDTANLTALLIAAEYLTDYAEKGWDKPDGILIVLNSCEEGLGNLKGVRQICQRYEGRIKELISFDCTMQSIVTKAVGSKRYEVEVLTEGGHSYSAFGSRNAIAYLADMIGTLYTLKVPDKGKTTYNVGMISGGTSVNTIAQQASMLYEFRSDDRENLRFMERHFQSVIEAYRAKGITVNVTVLGERPCMGEVPKELQNALADRAKRIIKKYTGMEAYETSASTDCNLPLSLGIPAIAFGGYIGGKSHTREEWLEINSLRMGLAVILEMVLTESGIFRE